MQNWQALVVIVWLSLILGYICLIISLIKDKNKKKVDKNV